MCVPFAVMTGKIDREGQDTGSVVAKGAIFEKGMCDWPSRQCIKQARSFRGLYLYGQANSVFQWDSRN